ncbi:MAG TPA: SPFH domain-containing protein, partial [Actinomycetota bacterium]|nr:SPFH domain-containing protein [Actinomycetota bacterium]
MTALIVVGVVLFIILFILLPLSIKVVREFQRLVIFRLGRMIGPKGPGIVFLIPIIDRPQWVDLREFFLEIPHQTSITKDNAP